ncbi:DUF6481 family protein [Sphingobium xenophagum]|nr:DUF6481 family protein [Sphingobium xenophagum]
MQDRLERMLKYKEPDFQERRALATQARDKALAKLRAKPPVDPELAAQRAAAAQAKAAAELEKRQQAKLAREEERAAKAERARLEAEAAAAAIKPALTDEERKAARDARYQARKSRKGAR